MEFINSILGVPLGLLMYISYLISGNYAGAILIFSFIVKVVLFPITFMAHKNSIRFLKIQPELNIIKKRYSEDKEELNEEQYQLFKREKYNVFIGMVPLILQLVLIMGMLQVMYRPLQHILRLDATTITTLVDTYLDVFNGSNGPMVQLQVLQILQIPENVTMFQNALSGYPEIISAIHEIANFNLSFLGMDLGITPSLTNVTIEWLIPLAAAVFSLVFCLVNNKLSPGAMTQTDAANNGMIIFTVVLSVYFTFVMPAGVGLYWAIGNLFGILVTFVLEWIYSPRKVVPEAVAYLEEKKRNNSLTVEEKMEKKSLRTREIADIKRFKEADKELVVYAIHGGQYKYYKNIIEYLLQNSDIEIHYLTNDPNDGIFTVNHPQIKPYYASQKKTITLLLYLKAKMFYTTVPDLQVFHMKRSVAQDDIEYIHTIHGIPSAHMTAREKAYDYFDTIFCVGPHHIREIQSRIQLADLKQKNLVKAGYPVYDQLVEAYEARRNQENKRPQILIAPSWQKDNILEICIDDVLKELVGKGYEIIVRPHIQFTMLFPEKMEALKAEYATYIETGEIVFDLNFEKNDYIFTADLIMTDWSGIAYEFSFCGLRPSLFINTPMKVLNPHYEAYGVEVTDITFRDKVGISVDLDEMSTIADKVAYLLMNKEQYEERIKNVVDEYLFYPGRSGEAGGKYIISQLMKRR